MECAMADGPVSLDPAEAQAAIVAWRTYAEQLQGHGAQDPALLARLRAMLGDTYAEFIDAKVVEQQARQAAYERMAAQARAHADKLENTRNNFRRGDDDVEERFNRIATD
jgi:hypothetical protein